MKRLILLIGVVSLLTGCATMQATSYYPQERFPATDPDKILILNAPPAKEHRVIGEVSLASATYSESQLRKKVSEIGGDAVILDTSIRRQPLVERGHQEVIVGPNGKMITYRRPQIHAERNVRIVGKIIKFQD